MPTHRRQRHLKDLKALAELLGEVADRQPRRPESSAGLDREAQATLSAVLPRLKSTCAAVFEIATEDSQVSTTECSETLGSLEWLAPRG